MNIIIKDGLTKMRFKKLLKSCKEHIRLCESYIINLESIAFNFIGMAYTDFHNLRSLYYSNGTPYSSIDTFIDAFENYKKEIGFIVTCSGRKDYEELGILKIKLLKSIEEIEKSIEEEKQNIST